MTIPYDKNVPANPDDPLATSQPQLLNNFDTLFNAFLENHISLSAASSAGNHTILELLQQESALETDLNEFSIYTKMIEGQTDQVFMRFQNNGTEFRFTNYQIYPVDLTNFFSFLPGNVIVYFGRINTLVNNVFTLLPPVARNIFSVAVIPIGPATGSTFKPLFSLVASPSGLFSKVIFKPASTISQLTPFHYIIMANF